MESGVTFQFPSQSPLSIFFHEPNMHHQTEVLKIKSKIQRKGSRLKVSGDSFMLLKWVTTNNLILNLIRTLISIKMVRWTNNHIEPFKKENQDDV